MTSAMFGRASTQLPKAASVASVTVLPNKTTPASALIASSLKCKVYQPVKPVASPSGALSACVGVGGPSQLRTFHTNVKVPEFTEYRKEGNKVPLEKSDTAEPSRVFSYLVTASCTAGCIYMGKNIVTDLLTLLEPSKQSKAMAKMEVDLSEIPEGVTMMFKWKGKPLFIRHRTDDDIARERSVNLNELRDPQHDEDRTRDPKWLVVLAVCTHLGCVPVMDAGSFGGFYCPCHGSHYDCSGRIRKGPAPLNLEVPYHEFPEEGMMVVG